MAATSVIVVNYNGGAFLPRCLAAVLAQEPPPSEVLVVDNASGDGSVDSLPDGVQLLRRPRNDGFGAAVNAGLDATRSPFTLTLNPDTELLPGCLAAATLALEQDAMLGSVALRVLQAGDPERLDAVGIGLTSRLGQINCSHGMRDVGTDTSPRPVLGPLGGAALWRRAALERAGRWAEHYFLYWEDFDVALRLDRAGYGCRTEPSARALHVGSGSVGRWSRRNVFYMVRNHWSCLLACLPGPLLRRHLGDFLLAPLRAAALYALRGRPFAALAGLVCGAAMLPGAYLRRRALPRTGTSRKAAERVATLLAAADEDRRAMKARA
ncbi:MAG: glycosyltransferase family 2 protein [Planctomycetota bacterium]|jgi:GT2 family glycosyltransferase